jgi:ribonucleoside-triphosphate reductase
MAYLQVSILSIIKSVNSLNLKNMSNKKLKIQSGTDTIEIDKVELVCWDCGKKIRKKDEFAHYVNEGKNYFKCKKCHEIEPQLHFQKCEVFSRIVGYIRPVQQWNTGKALEFKDRKVFKFEG